MAQSVTTFFMFEGRAKEAIDFYATLFSNARISSIEYLDDGSGRIKRALLELPGQTIICMDSPTSHSFTFTPATSLFVVCDDEEEIDKLAAALSHDGQFYMALDRYDFSRKFCWVADRFGISWQLNLP